MPVHGLKNNKQTRNPIFEIYSTTTLLIAFKAHHNYCALLELQLPLG